MDQKAALAGMVAVHVELIGKILLCAGLEMTDSLCRRLPRERTVRGRDLHRWTMCEEGSGCVWLYATPQSS